MVPERSVLITGCSSGIGLDAARTLRARGWRVLATCRQPADCARLEADAPDGRHTGTSAWAGILNTHWWVDPASGVAGVLATQLLPFMDPGLIRTYDAFVRATARGR